MSLSEIQAAWNKFFFDPVSPKPIALFRIGIGILAFLNYLLIAPDLFHWYSERGVLTSSVAKTLSGGGGINLLSALPPTDGWLVAFFVVAMLSTVTLTLGFWTRASAAILFLTLASFNHRNTLVLNSGDSILRLASFYLIFSHAGAAYSLERYLKGRNGKTPPPVKLVAPWVMRLLQIQLCLIYLYTFTWKVMGSMWLDGTAVYYTARLQEFWRFHTPYIFEHMWTIKLWTWATLVLEFALGAFLWIKELRYPILLGGVLLHLGIDYSMNIPLFGQLMICFYILFVDPADIDRAMAWVKRKLPSKGATAPVSKTSGSTRRPAQAPAA
ncbi:MAG: HTTM domain-containing protein [Verrucomicrobiales bacterium]